MKQAAATTSDVSRETRERLECYVALLLKWNTTINLISTRDAAIVWQRHIADSVGLAQHIPARTAAAIDLGSGAGLPGLVLAITTGIPFHLVEGDHRKASFLREAARATAAPVTVHASRIEGLVLPQAALVTARALAPLPTLLRWAVPLMRPDGIGLFPKGRNVSGELEHAAAEWIMNVERLPSETDPHGCILRISEVRPVHPH